MDLLGHIAYGFTAIGVVLVGRKLPIGWLFRCAGALGWVAVGLTIGMSSLWTWSIVFATMDIYNWRKWNATVPEPEN